MIERAAYSIIEAAEITGLSVSSVQRWIRRGELGSIRVGHRVLIPRTELERHLVGFTSSAQPVEPESDTPWARAVRHAEERAS